MTSLPCVAFQADDLHTRMRLAYMRKHGHDTQTLETPVKGQPWLVTLFIYLIVSLPEYGKLSFYGILPYTI